MTCALDFTRLSPPKKKSTVCHRAPALIHSFSFHSFLHVLGGLPFSKAGFQGPSFKKKKYIYKVKCNSIINKEKSSTKSKKKNKWCYAIMAFSFSLKVGKVLAFLPSLGSEFQILAPCMQSCFAQISFSFLGALDLPSNLQKAKYS